MPWVASAAFIAWLLGGAVDPQARAAFVPFLVQVGEGSTTWLYLDDKCNVTIGVGNMLPTVDDALALDWAGAPEADVRAAWYAVTTRRDLAGRGGGAFRTLTTVRATQASIDELIERDILTYEPVLRQTFPDYDSVPWPAQVGLMRMAWAMGPAFASGGKWPNFRAGWSAKQYRICAAECRIPELDATEPHANADTAALFVQAAEMVEAQGTPADS